MEVRKGYVEHIVFRNNDNGYTVFQLVSEEEELTCVGLFSVLAEGELVQVSGYMKEHPLYGEQLQVEQYELLAKEMLKRKKEGRPLTFYHYMLDLEHGPCIYKRISGCGSGTEYMAVTPWGELYPCHQFVGDEKYSMGDIWKGVTNKEVQDEFKCCNAYAREGCKDCWAKLYCSGGCAANAYHATGSITGIYEYGCDLFKKRIECAIMMKVSEASE